MKRASQDRRRALAFVASSVLLLAFALAVVGGLRFARHDHVYHVVVRESVAGLRAASIVEYKGVPVGVVRDIAFSDGSVESVRVELAIRRDVPIKVDTRARLRAKGITGLYALELVGGTTAAPELREGGTIEVSPSIFSELEATVHDVSSLARRLNAATATLGSDAAASVAALHSALVAGNDAARALAATAATIGSEVRETALSFRRSSESFQAVLGDPAWRSLGGEVLSTLEDVRRTIAKLERTADKAEQIAGENRDDVRAVVENLKRASGDVRAAARRLRESPSSLVFEHVPVEKPIPDPIPAPPERSRP